MNELEKKFRIDLGIDLGARFTGNSRGTPIEAKGFKNGALWAFQWFSRQQWVSVKDSLPEPGIRVLCYGTSININFGRYVETTEYGSIFRVGISMPTYNVTHWMPLPEPPK